jgi:PEGA domain
MNVGIRFRQIAAGSPVTGLAIGLAIAITSNMLLTTLPALILLLGWATMVFAGISYLLMPPRRRFVLGTGVLLATLFAAAAPAFPRGKQAKLKIHVSPPQAYVFLDGTALKQGSCAGLFCTIWVDPGEYKVTVRNYGFAPESRKVKLELGKTTKLDISLKPEGGPVPGPWGRIQIKGPSHAAVLLNGKGPDSFVGYVDEFNNSFIFQQELLVNPGTYLLTATWWGEKIWSGPVTVKANERVIVNVNRNGAIKTTPWTRLQKLSSPLPRFKAGFATTRVVVAPSKGEISASESTVQESRLQSSTKP